MSMHRSLGSLALVLLSAGVLAAGCSRATTSPIRVESGAPSSQALATPIASPSFEPSVPPSVEGSPPGPTATDAPPTEPPAASLSVEGGDPVVGELGSYTWIDHGADAPWLPGRPIRIGAGESLALTLNDPVRLASWTVSRSPSNDPGSDVVGMGHGSAGPVTFAAPPRGSWSIHVNVWFADNLGSAAYFWLVEVD